MLAEKKRSAIVGIAGGFALMFVAYLPVLLSQSLLVLLTGALLILVGCAMYIYGCVAFATGKGYSGIIGFLLGFFLGWIGLVILAVLPDKMKQSSMVAQPVLAGVGGYGGGYPGSYPAPQGGYADTFAGPGSHGTQAAAYGGSTDMYGAPGQHPAPYEADATEDPFFHGAPSPPVSATDAGQSVTHPALDPQLETAPAVQAATQPAIGLGIAPEAAQGAYGYADGNGHAGGNGGGGNGAGGLTFTIDQPAPEFQWDSRKSAKEDTASAVSPAIPALDDGHPVPAAPAPPYHQEPAEQSDAGQAGSVVPPEARGASMPQFNSAPSSWPPANHWSQPQS